VNVKLVKTGLHGSMAIMDLIKPLLTLDTAFFIGECVLTISFTMSSLLFVRLFAMLSALIIITASCLVGFNQVGMLSYFIFASISFVINATHICRILYSNLPAVIHEKYKMMYELNFSSLSPKEFSILLSFGSNSIKKNAAIILERECCDVQLNVTGGLQVVSDGVVITTLPPNSLVGEISFLTGKPSIAGVNTLGEAEIYSWNREALLRVKAKYPNIYIKFYDILLSKVVDKLSSANKAIQLGAR
jgi:hypothetical protein